MKSRISVTRAAREFSDLLNRVRYRGEEFVIERGGKPICRLTAAHPPRFTLADLARLLESMPKPDKGYWDAVARITRRQPAVHKSPWQS